MHIMIFNGQSQSQFEHGLMFLNIFYMKSFKNVTNFWNENRNHVSILYHFVSFYFLLENMVMTYTLRKMFNNSVKMCILNF
jgi:hypothetical protein